MNSESIESRKKCANNGELQSGGRLGEPKLRNQKRINLLVSDANNCMFLIQGIFHKQIRNANKKLSERETVHYVLLTKHLKSHMFAPFFIEWTV
jgi:hypothetical protein